jgi:hypothetical protein
MRAASHRSSSSFSRMIGCFAHNICLVAEGESQRLSAYRRQRSIILASEYDSGLFTDGALPKSELMEVHRSQNLAPPRKADCTYPTIRLPFTFSGLIGLSMRIYQTVRDGVLAFLAVVSRAGTILTN